MSDSKCDEVRAAFQRLEVPSGSWLGAHLASCERCRELMAGEGMLGRSLATLPKVEAVALDELRRTVVEAARRERGLRAWLRSRSRRQRVAFALLAVALLAALVYAGNRRADFATSNPLAFWGYAAALLVTTLVLTLSLMPRPNQRQSAGDRLRVALAFACIPALFVAHVAYSGLHGPAPLPAMPGPRAAACFLYGSLMTAAYLSWLWVLNRTDAVAAGWAILAATAAGLVGNLGLHLHCSGKDPGHLLFGHAGVLVAWAVIYPLVVALLQSSRARRASHDA
jgi:hypothetical protein